MELKAYFSSIHRVIIDHLSKARTEIVAAVAWFTDRDIFEVLCEKARSGVQVTVALNGDEINQGPGGLNFHRLVNLGGKIVFVPLGSRSDPIMSHKFCVIDGVSVITGSYDWSKKARSSDENITVISDSEAYANRFLEAFHGLLARAGQAARTPTVLDNDAIRHRLELIRSLVLLGEQDEIAPHIRNLHSATETTGLGRIIAALNAGQFKTALELINEYLIMAPALIMADESDVTRLRFELSILEVRLESLSDEKAELERRMITFNRRYDEVLGDVTQRILRARVTLARQDALQHNASAVPEERDAAKDAEDAHADYSRHHEELRNENPLPSLGENDEHELKVLYRKACSLCHPDKFPEDRKVAAHRAFTELQDAYKSNDLNRVREIHASLAVGGFSDTRSTTLSKVDALRAAIAEMEHAIACALMELRALHGSYAYKLLEAAGASEAAWQQYLDRQREMLEKEYDRLVLQMRGGESEESIQRMSDR